MDISVVVVALMAVVLLVLLLLVGRRVRLLRSGGIHVALRTRVDESGKGWAWGVGRYHGDQFAWFRAISLRTGPDRILHRDGLEIASRREPDHVETPNLPSGSRVLRFEPPGGGAPIEVAMGPDALTGFLSWMESAPPGTRLPWAS
ncbi:DUF2550 domain-containing protein [Actinokineospora globicatena]|uniref:DUF2550 domain-containing protein n=1 Tax=Actinokineospora globicatena TaxID=103729 RepID=A0A9W6QKE0_9PSEU|nr:DUF2550 domain-containing protein [Actinokineospora globicatena]MCP2302447.1 Protein of unknown function (DUF2550) [Actinokineospora globicatena]GLW75870.1 hypothetical protein Aglo01_03520 [Actinokineospora globicatena]GLW82708.1 hypothetical protein Aglo02_03490 [Actinokineospora globicatena]GLW91661.1 hypothetical protein Aglo03_24770 [Actinokineospora globicatena]